MGRVVASGSVVVGQGEDVSLIAGPFELIFGEPEPDVAPTGGASNTWPVVVPFGLPEGRIASSKGQNFADGRLYQMRWATLSCGESSAATVVHFTVQESE